MKDIKHFILEGNSKLNKYFINESISKKTKIELQEYINELKPFLSKIIPNLNDKWKKSLETFKNYTLEKAFDEAKDKSLRDYRGYEGRFSYNDGFFSRYESCWCYEDEDTIKELNNKKIKNNAYEILLSTCCEYLESVGYNDPSREWTVKHFRYTDVAMTMIIGEIISNK